MYYSVYDGLKLSLLQYGMSPSYAPMTAGTMARLVAAVVVSPIELVRTNAQSQHGTASGWQLYRSMLFSYMCGKNKCEQSGFLHC